jgi:hypothetical protein
MNSPKTHQRRIIEVTILLIVCITAVSLVSPAVSKKPQRVIDKTSDDGANDVVGIEVYWDAKGTSRVDSIEWGPIEPGSVNEVIVFVKNKGKSAVVLSYFVSNWNALELSDCLQLSWDYSGQVLGFKDVVEVVFTLCASESAQPIENFSFDITVLGN